MAITTYPELSREDIILLTQVLGYDSRYASGARDGDCLRRLIHDLPSHLRNKLPCLSTGCSAHRRLNMSVVEDIVSAFQDEAGEGIWNTLLTRGELHPDQHRVLTEVKARVRFVTEYDWSHCAACFLENLGRDVSILVALGTCIVGRISTKIYARSKRLIWIEEMIKTALRSSETNAAIHRMWSTGIELRSARKAAGLYSLDRPYINDYMRQARKVKRPASRLPDSMRAERSLRTYGKSAKSQTRDARFGKPDDTTSHSTIANWLAGLPSKLSAGDLKWFYRRRHVGEISKPVDPWFNDCPSGRATFSTNLEKVPSEHARGSCAPADIVGRPLSQRTSERLTPAENSRMRHDSANGLTGTAVIDLYRESVCPGEVGLGIRYATMSSDPGYCKRCSRSSSELCTYHYFKRRVDGKRRADGAG